MHTYRDNGWAGLGDWLGTANIASFLRQYRSFEEARAFARNLGLKSQTEWIDYCRSGEKPDDIPSKPDNGYADQGWVGMGDWLGTGTIATHLREYLSFKKARAFARNLDLKSETEWRGYCKSDKRPSYIPSNPDKMYANDGWAGMGDWLGYAR
jgi:hypothetical protein